MLEAIMCLAMAIYFEARSEPVEGQMAVAQVVMNRVANTRYPSEVCEVVKQKYQFAFYWDGKPETVHNKDAWGTAFIYASAVYSGLVPDTRLLKMLKIRATRLLTTATSCTGRLRNT